MSERVDRATGEIIDRTTFTATGTLASLLDATKFREQLRDLDAAIATADITIGNLKKDLKNARAYRENLVAALRATARGDQALPYDEPANSDPQKGPA